MSQKGISVVMVLVLLVVAVGGYFLYSTHANVSMLKDEISSIQYSNLLVNNEIMKLEADLNASRIEFENLQDAGGISATLGLVRVNASRLNIRVNPNTIKDPIGTLSFNALVDVIDTSNPLWFKVRVNPWQYQNREEFHSGIAFNDQNESTVMIIKNEYMDCESLSLGDEYYVSSRYLTEVADQFVIVDVSSNAQSPFTYGLLFFEPEIAGILENQIWNNMKEDLTAMGYDGVQVVPYRRDEFQNLVKDNYFDAVESSPGDFVNANMDRDQLEAFAKTRNKLDNSTSYTGIIITNRNSGITSFQDLRGRDIIIPGVFSESGFVYQRFFLEKVHGIDIENEATLLDDHSHQDVFLKVARGDAEAGFCGDFVLKDPPSRFARSAENLGIILETQEQLRNLRNQIIVHPMEGMSRIPNNPHSIRKDLASNTQFVSNLREVVRNSYETYREDFGLVDAITQEYGFLRDLR